jgi:hypothetical protein
LIRLLQGFPTLFQPWSRYWNSTAPSKIIHWFLAPLIECLYIQQALNRSTSFLRFQPWSNCIHWSLVIEATEWDMQNICFVLPCKNKQPPFCASLMIVDRGMHGMEYKGRRGACILAMVHYKVLSQMK